MTTKQLFQIYNNERYLRLVGTVKYDLNVRLNPLHDAYDKPLPKDAGKELIENYKLNNFNN